MTLGASGLTRASSDAAMFPVKTVNDREGVSNELHAATSHLARKQQQK
jgi:hypothetical protein